MSVHCRDALTIFSGDVKFVGSSEPIFLVKHLNVASFPAVSYSNSFSTLCDSPLYNISTAGCAHFL